MVLTAMLVASINYANNMAYILTFMIFSLMLIALIHTRNNVKGLSIANLMPEPVFAGETLQIKLELQNHSFKLRHGVWLTHGDNDGMEELCGPFSVEAGSNSNAEIVLHARHRGSFTLSRILLITVYPLGIFVAKGEIVVNKNYLVYPHPEGTRNWPEPEPQDYESGEGYHLKGGDDYTGSRPYRPGEPMHHIDWKAVARGRPLSIKEFTGGGVAKLYFTWDHVQGMGTEPRLSQMCRWVLEADEQGSEFGLKLPGTKIPPASGSLHTQKCLEALALFKS